MHQTHTGDSLGSSSSHSLIFSASVCFCHFSFPLLFCRFFLRFFCRSIRVYYEGLVVCHPFLAFPKKMKVFLGTTVFMVLAVVVLGKGFGESCSKIVTDSEDNFTEVKHCSESGLVCTTDACDPGLTCGHGDKCRYDIGHACKTNDECSEFCFNQACSFHRGPGTKCKKHGDCYGGLVCTQNICGHRKYLKPGSKCKSTVECEFGCTGGKCDAKYKSAGCTNDIQCPRTGEKCVCNRCCAGSIMECKKSMKCT
ncbi:hypothetical protein BC940DRAFT_306229 [Gongronella butleri]|nr:hypothetical protein BC940DRAFT_306229 [Gongronella butleri]